MGTISRVKTWTSGETLTAANLNSEFNNVLNGVNSNSLDATNLDASDTYIFAELVVGSGISGADGNQLHVHTATAGSVTASVDADELVLENSGNTGITLLAGATSNAAIYFGDSGDNDIGKIDYDHNGNTLAVTVNTAEVLSLTSAATIFNDPGNDVDFRIETNNIANGFVVDGGLDVFAFGAAAADDKFITISPPAASHTATTDTYALHVTAGGAQTIPSGTTALVASVAIEEPNITATGTVTSAATLYVKSAPTEGSSNYALWVDAGAVQFDAGLTVGTDVSAGNDLLLTSSGAVINFNSGDVTLTHSSNTLTVAGGTLATAALTASTITGSGALSIDDATDSTSGTTGSVHTDGGLGAVKDIFTDATLNAAGDTAAGDNAAIGYTSAEGLILTGQGSTSDVVIKNDADATVISIPTGTTKVGIGTTAADSLLHVENGDSGQTAHANADEFHIESSSGQVGMTISGPANNAGNIFFADNAGVNPGSIIYDHNTDDMTFYATDDIVFAPDSSEAGRFTGGKLGIGTVSPDGLLDVEGTGNTYAYLQTSSTDHSAYMTIKIPASGVGDPTLWLIQGSGNGDANNMGYRLRYEANANQLTLRSEDIDGSSNGADIFRIPDAQTTIDANTTWDENVFDYVCDDCGWHSAVEPEHCPECGGHVEWHDDVALMRQATTPSTQMQAMSKLKKLGIVSDYRKMDNGKIEAFQSIQRSTVFEWSAMAQQQARIEELEAKVDELTRRAA